MLYVGLYACSSATIRDLSCLVVQLGFDSGGVVACRGTCVNDGGRLGKGGQEVISPD